MANKRSGSKSGENGTRTKSRSSKEGGNMEMALKEFFIDAIKDIYWAEKHLIKALIKMEKESTTEELKEAFADHRAQTEVHVNRLESVFELLEKKPQAKKCEAMQGLIEEGQSVIEETEKGTATRDVALIIAAQKAEHYEIATYGGLSQLARTMGMDEIAGLLEETLNEEKETDQLLTQIAEENVNYQATEELTEAED